MSARAATAAALLLGACSIDQGPYEPTIDAGAGHIVMNPSPALLTEGNTTQLFVHVETPPVLPTFVGCSSNDFPRLHMTPDGMMFTVEDADQVVTLEAQEDADAMDDQLMVTCASLDLVEGLTNVVITDNDVLAIVATPNGDPPVSVAEMQSTNIQVRLSAQPPTNLIVSVAHAGTKISTAPAVLTFTPSNYDLSQNVIVTGVRDADNVTDSDSLTLSSTGLTTVSVPISVTDID